MIPLRPNLFHLLRDTQRLTRRMEGAACKAMETAKRTRQADREAHGLIRRWGPRLQVKAPLPQAEDEETQAIAPLLTISVAARRNPSGLGAPHSRQPSLLSGRE